MDWNGALPAKHCTCIIGNPPFYGAWLQSKEQNAKIQDIFRNAYGVDFNGDEEKIVAHLFKLYAEATKNEKS